jgi:hypothetical protein
LLATSRKMGPLQGASGPVIGALVAEISLVGGAVINPPPIKPLAVIIAEQDAVVGIPSQLDGSDSSASFGAPLNYAWTLLEVPSGSNAQLSDPTSVDPYFVPDLPGDYLVQLVVDDGTLTSEPAVANITAQEPSAGADNVGVRRNHLFYLDLNGNDAWDIGVDGVFPFGVSMDLPLIGDWNGDGIDDIGVRRNNLFFLDLNGNRVWDPGVDGVFAFGLSTDLPVIGDWNADGIDDFGIRRDHLFFLDLNGNNAWDVGVDGVFPFGVSGDKPIAGKW